MTSTTSRETPERGLPGSLRAAALPAMVVGAVGSLGLLFHASRRRPPLLMAIFVIWVVLPFAALVFANVVSKRWPALTRATLHSAMVVVALGSLAIYGHDAWSPRRAQAAFVYVMVPPASVMLGVVVVGIAAFLSRRSSRRK